MEWPFRLLLVVGLLAALLPGAAATVGPHLGSTCEPTKLATHVSLFCPPDPDMLTAECCVPLVAAFDLRGGIPCLCRVAAEPQLVMAGLNATHLLTIYTSCGGLRPGGVDLAAACEDEAPAPPRDHGAAHSKAVPAYTVTSPLVPAAIPPPAPQTPHSGAPSSEGITCAMLIASITIILFSVRWN